MAENRKLPPLSQRREAFATRQAGRPEGRLEGPGPLGYGPPNRHGMPTDPIGQRRVDDWPVLDLGDHPEVSLADWRLEVDGLVERPQVFTWADFAALPQTREVSDFHCVTGWSRMDNRWEGVRFADLCAHVGLRAEAGFVLATAYDRDPGSGEAYSANLPLAEALKPDVLLVHRWEGAPLPREHGGPVRLITPQRYAWKGAKWVRRITLLREDQRGFWERRGYSNTADPWRNDRYGKR